MELHTTENCNERDVIFTSVSEVGEPDQEWDNILESHKKDGKLKTWMPSKPSTVGEEPQVHNSYGIGNNKKAGQNFWENNQITKCWAIQKVLNEASSKGYMVQSHSHLFSWYRLRSYHIPNLLVSSKRWALAEGTDTPVWETRDLYSAAWVICIKMHLSEVTW